MRAITTPSGSEGIHVHRLSKWNSYEAAKAFLEKHYADDEARGLRLMKKFENAKMKARWREDEAFALCALSRSFPPLRPPPALEPELEKATEGRAALQATIVGRSW